MEEDAHLTIHTNEGDIVSERSNTTLYTYFGELALYNNVFIETVPEPPTGMFVFPDSPFYEDIATFVIENDFPMILNRNEVPQCDIDAWNHAHLDDLEDGIPEEWLK